MHSDWNLLLPWFVPSGILLLDAAATRNMAARQMESRARPVLLIHVGRPRTQIYATQAPGFAGAIRRRNVHAVRRQVCDETSKEGILEKVALMKVLETCWPWRLRLHNANIDLQAEMSPEQSMLVSTLSSSMASVRLPRLVSCCASQ